MQLACGGGAGASSLLSIMVLNTLGGLVAMRTSVPAATAAGCVCGLVAGSASRRPPPPRTRCQLCWQGWQTCVDCRKDKALEIMDYTKLCKENSELEQRVASLDRKAQISTINSSNATAKPAASSLTASTRRALSASRSGSATLG